MTFPLTPEEQITQLREALERAKQQEREAKRKKDKEAVAAAILFQAYFEKQIAQLKRETKK